MGALKLVTHVDDLDLRQRPLLDPLGEFQQLVLPPQCVVILFERRRRRTQHDRSVRHLGPHHGHIAGVISGSLILLVGMIVLFINNDESEVRQRRENCRARTYHNVGLTVPDALPLLGALVFA